MRNKELKLKKVILVFGLVYFLFSSFMVPLSLSHMSVHEQMGEHGDQHKKPVCAWYCSGYIVGFYDNPNDLNVFMPFYQTHPIGSEGIIHDPLFIDFRIRPPPFHLS